MKTGIIGLVHTGVTGKIHGFLCENVGLYRDDDSDSAFHAEHSSH